MNRAVPIPCDREEELLDALGRSFVDPDLAAHAAACPTCRELRLVAEALLHDRARSLAEAPVPPAGLVWWRMQVRRRHEARAAARRTLLLGQAATIALAAALVGLLLGGRIVRGLEAGLAATPLGTPVLVGIAMLVALLPLAGYLVLRRV